ncbi:MAG: TniQ family protein [Mycobacterium sp.]|nr:TniQ family protein [Mycobacterium sp.]
MSNPPCLPIPAGPAQHETLASYLTRLAGLHGLAAQELWATVSDPLAGTGRRAVAAQRLAALTGRHPAQLARALPELRNPPPDWTMFRHQPQPGCRGCDARHDGGPVIRLLPHHRYVCSRHRYWIGPPDIGEYTSALPGQLDDIARAQRQHLRLLHRHGVAATYDAVLTGFLICGHLWADQSHFLDQLTRRSARRAELLIPPRSEHQHFSASRIFAAVYPEAVSIAVLLASPFWRHLAAGATRDQQQFLHAIATRIGCRGYQPPSSGDAIAHWMKFDSWRPPSRPQRVFPDTRAYHATRPIYTDAAGQRRTLRSATWFAINRRGGNVILHHRHIRPVLIRDWSPRMDGIGAAIWASRTTTDLAPRQTRNVG